MTILAHGWHQEFLQQTEERKTFSYGREQIDLKGKMWRNFWVNFIYSLITEILFRKITRVECVSHTQYKPVVTGCNNRALYLVFTSSLLLLLLLPNMSANMWGTPKLQKVKRWWFYFSLQWVIKNKLTTFE